MAQLTLRGTKGVPLTNAEVDSNFEALNLGLQNLADSKVSKVLGKNLSDQNFSGNEKAKLAGMAPNATANESDAFLLDRVNHTGTQSISTIENLPDELDSKVDKVTGYGLSEENFTTAEKNKLSGLSNFPEAPEDGKVYGRKNGAWEEVINLPGSYVPATTHTTAPTDGVDTDNPYLYYNQTTGEAKMYLRAGAGEYIEMGSAQVDPGTPPEEIDPNAMLLGLNSTWVNYWAHSTPFANLLYQGIWERTQQDPNVLTYDRGTYTLSDKTQNTRIVLSSDGSKLPAGTYTILNPDGLQVYFGDYGVPSVEQYSTATVIEYEHTPAEGAVCLHVRGDLTNTNGNLAVIIPGHLASWNAGNVWNQAFLDFYSGLKIKVFRTMDMTIASGNFETDWVDRSMPTSVKIGNAFSDGGNNIVPWEFIFDLAGRLQMDPWICIPHRATQDYVDQLATLIHNSLPAGRKVWLELSNEVWNWGSAWAQGTAWVSYLDFTKSKFSMNPVSKVATKVAHGLVDGTKLDFFTDKTSTGVQFIGVAWRLGGSNGYVKVLSADTFELYNEVGLTTKLEIPATTKPYDVIYYQESEAGKTADLNGNYGLVSKRNWDTINPVVGREKCVNLICRQFGNASTISGALAVTGVKAATDFVAVAPYFGGRWVGAKLEASDGVVTPYWWCNLSTKVYVGVYAHGATPTKQEVIDGTGALKSGNITYGADTSSWSSAVFTATGLTNGTSYDVHFVFTDEIADFELVGTITPSASAVEPVIITDTFANQKLRNIIGSSGPSRSLGWANVKTAAEGVPLVNYECGLHFHESAPSEISNWKNNLYQESPEFGQAMIADARFNQVNGTRLHTYYADVLGTTFSIATTIYDVTDERYLAYKSLGGYINPIEDFVADDIVFDKLADEPPSYPATIGALPGTGIDYSIIGGNLGNRYALEGGTLKLVDATGLDFENPEVHQLYFKATKNGVSKFFKGTASIGDAWFELDALWAWDAVKDTDPSDGMQLRIGPKSVTTKSAGTPVASGGLWTMDGSAAFGTDTGPFGPPSDIDLLNNDLFFAVTIKVPTGMPNYKKLLLVANNPRVHFIYESGNLRAEGSAGGTTVAVPLPAETLKVVWGVLRNGKDMTAGGNQTIVNTASSETTISSISNYFILPNFTPADATGVGYGAFQIVSRPSITDAEAKAMVAKMQTLHGVA